MSAHVDNLERAARLIKRFGDIEGAPSDYEGVALTEILGDVLMAAHDTRNRELAAAMAFRCNPDESAGMAEVVSLTNYSKRV